MTITKNPFSFKELSETDPFCDRQKELSNLVAYARARSNVLLFSPRRYGKTSLVRRVQAELSKEGAVTAFSDFFGVTSIEDVAFRLAKAVYEVTHRRENLFMTAINFIKSFRPVLKPDETGSVTLSVEPSSEKKGGAELLEETMTSIGEFINSTQKLFHIALDEFQEIVELKDSSIIEGIMRTHIQRHPASYFFVGSRRHILLAMFNEKKRPFFQSAVNYELKTLPADELVNFIHQQFDGSGKECAQKIAEEIVRLARQHPYYTQKLSFFVYESTGRAISLSDIKAAFNTFVESERPVFDAIIQGLAPQQIVLLKAIAREPTASIFSIAYMKHNRMGSTGGAQGALKRLVALDLVERGKDGCYRLTDPILELWLRKD